MNQEPARSIRIDSNRSGFSMALQTLGASISAIFQVTGLQLGSKFSPRGPALGYVKKFHPLLVKNERKHRLKGPRGSKFKRSNRTKRSGLPTYLARLL